MSEKVLGLPEKNLVDFVSRNWFKMHGGKIPTIQGQILLVPVVSVEWLKDLIDKRAEYIIKNTSKVFGNKKEVATIEALKQVALWELNNLLVAVDTLQGTRKEAKK